MITLKEIDKFEQFITEILDGGIAMIQNIEFRSTELPKFRNEARKLAVQAAKDKAKLIAQGVEVILEKLLPLMKKKSIITYGIIHGGEVHGVVTDNLRCYFPS